MNIFSYNLSESEYLVFQTHLNHFELYSSHEGSTEKSKMATYKGGKWVFESYQQKKLFWFLYGIYKDQFYRAIKAYNRSLKEKPALYEFSCIRRKFNIKITKLRRGCSDWFYGLWPTREF